MRKEEMGNCLGHLIANLASREKKKEGKLNAVLKSWQKALQLEWQFTTEDERETEMSPTVPDALKEGMINRWELQSSGQSLCL